MANEGGAHNYTVIGSNTPAAVGNGPLHLARIWATSAITGTVTIYDNQTAASGTIIWTQATPVLGTPFELLIRVKNGAWVVPGSAGSVIVTYDP